MISFSSVWSQFGHTEERPASLFWSFNAKVKQMATIRMHRGKWQAIVRRKGYPQQSRSFIIKAHARKWARQLESDLDAGVVPTNTKLLDETSVADLLIRYRDTVTIHKKGRSSEVTLRSPEQ